MKQLEALFRSTTFMAANILLITTFMSSSTCLYFQNGEWYNGHASFLPEFSADDAQVYRWRGVDYFGESNFTIVTKPVSQKCGISLSALDSLPIDIVFCGDELHWHWPHAVQNIYYCFGWFLKHPSARWVMFAKDPLFHRGLQERIALFNITVVPSLPPPACTHDIIITKNPGALGDYSGWHNKGHGPTFLSASSANVYRDTLLRKSMELGFDVRRGPPATHSSILARVPSKLGLGNLGPSKRLTIGFINREKANRRRILNPDSVREWLASFRGFRYIEVKDMIQVGSFLRQCQFVSQLDIIVTPHGAQMVNMACAAPCTVVVEVFPKHYFIPGFFSPLVAAHGLTSFGIYSGIDGFNDTDICCEDFRNPCCANGSSSNITVPPVLPKLLPTLLKAHEQCCRHAKCWL